MPLHGPGLTVLQDVTRWREAVHAPDLEANCAEGWEDALALAEKLRGEKLVCGFMGTGIFEQCHFLMGFEATLANLYEHPEEMRALIDYITEYRLTYARMLIDKLHPDAIFSHDDWGTRRSSSCSRTCGASFIRSRTAASTAISARAASLRYTTATPTSPTSSRTWRR